MKMIDREGIFRALPREWSVRTANESEAIAISIQFLIVAYLNGTEWEDWTEYEEHGIRGDFWVVKKTGEINEQAVQSLAESLGWSGDLDAVHTGPPPGGQVQITVREEEYRGRKQLKVAYLNPFDFVPKPVSASPDKVQAMQRRFGSLLRAAAAGAVKPGGQVQTPRAAPPKPAVAPASCAVYSPDPGPLGPTPAAEDDLPF